MEQGTFRSRPADIILINGQGEELDVISLKIGGKKETYRWVDYNILPDTPVNFQLTYPRTSYARQLVMKINDDTYRIDRLPILLYKFILMKKLSILLLTYITVPDSAFAQHKVIEESGKKPAWVYGAQSGYVIGMATAGNVEEARDMAMNSIREQITESVAVHITSVSQDMVREIISGNKTQFDEEYQRMTKTQTGKRDYLKGISPGRIES
ncbi:MAG: hypothetical protein U5L09_11190 [Bacteroidales bacterium]|nr:hypothetical protein [Bacteroidales bacterium]